MTPALIAEDEPLLAAERGLVPGSGRGTGLANIRARLKAMYGTAATLSLHLNEPLGVVAEIGLPASPP